jgi:anaerobic selenocysteine-containing dehydrogenase
MSDLTRRGFVKNSAAATAGMTVIGALLTGQADAHAGGVGGDGNKAVLAYVRDPSKGDIAVLSGDREVHVNDRKLAAAIARAANNRR